MVGTRSRSGAYDEGVGQELKAARVARNLSLDDVAVAIRIPPHQLKSLEDANLSYFAAEIYARGAYLKYAKYLGVDDERRQRAFWRSLSGVRERVPLRLPQTASWLQRVWTPTGVIVLSLAAALSSVAGYLVWQVQSFVRVPDLEWLEPQAQVLEEREVMVRGKTEPEASVVINGETVALEADNTFNFALPLKGGINVVQVEATGAAGRTNVITRHLLVPRS